MFVTEDAFKKWEEKQKLGWLRTQADLTKHFTKLTSDVAELRAEIVRLRDDLENKK